MKKTLRFIGVMASVVVISCNKSTDINIVTPTEGQNFRTGDMVEVKAKIYDPDWLSGVALTAIAETGDTIYHYTVDLDGQSYTLLKRFQLTSPGMCKIEIDTWGGYGSSKSVMINVN